MPENRPSAGGFQIAFLVFAVAFLAAPAHKYLMVAGWPAEYTHSLDRLLVLGTGALLLIAVPALRRRSIAELRIPIPAARSVEVAWVIAGHAMVAFAAAGAVVLWYWIPGGEAALARRLGQQDSATAEWRYALSADGFLTTLLIAGILAPIVEELVFRGLLYRTWAVRWGWFTSMLATSAVFAAFHANYFSSFCGSIILICILRRTGSLRAPILVHMTFNVLLWYPLMGQFVFPVSGRETGELGPWCFQLTCLIATVIALPIYVFISRDSERTQASANAEAVSATS